MLPKYDIVDEVEFSIEHQLKEIEDMNFDFDNDEGE